MLRQSTGLRNALAGPTGFAATFANGIIEIYSGAQPLTADSAATGVLLGVVTTNGGAFTPGSTTNGLTFASPSAGVVSKSSSAWSFTGIANGTAGWFRLKGNALDDNGASTTLPRLDGNVASAGGNMTIPNTAIVINSPNTIDAFSYEIPAQ